MEKYAILLGYYEKQWVIIEKLRKQILSINLSVHETKYEFALKTQQFYSAIEDLLKQIAKSFENHVQDLSLYHKELLIRLHTDIPLIRPRVLSEESFFLLDKVRAFRHFIRHAYDCELLEEPLQEMQSKMKAGYPALARDFLKFKEYVQELTRF